MGKKRSKYRPKTVCLDNMSYLLQGFTPVRLAPKAVSFRTANHLALSELSKGKAERRDIEVLLTAMNIADALIEMKVGEEYQKEVTAGKDALRSVALRMFERGRYLCTGPELTALNLAMDVHDAQLDSITVEKLERACEEVDKHILAQRAEFLLSY